MHAHEHTLACMHAHKCTRMRACTHTHAHTHTYTHVHTYTHTHAHRTHTSARSIARAPHTATGRDMPCTNFAGYPGPLTADRAAELLAEDKAIEDALHVLDRALADSRLSIKPYLKVTAAASRPTRMALARGGGGTGPRRGWHWPAAGMALARGGTWCTHFPNQCSCAGKSRCDLWPRHGRPQRLADQRGWRWVRFCVALQEVRRLARQQFRVKATLNKVTERQRHLGLVPLA